MEPGSRIRTHAAISTRPVAWPAVLVATALVAAVLTSPAAGQEGGFSDSAEAGPHR